MQKDFFSKNWGNRQPIPTKTVRKRKYTEVYNPPFRAGDFVVINDQPGSEPFEVRGFVGRGTGDVRVVSLYDHVESYIHNSRLSQTSLVGQVVSCAYKSREEFYVVRKVTEGRYFSCQPLWGKGLDEVPLYLYDLIFKTKSSP